MSDEIDKKTYQVTFDIEPLAKKLDISKDKCAELLANEIMKLLGLL